MKARRINSKQGGFVIIVVLCMVMLLSVLLLGFHHKARADLLSVDHFRKSEQALHCARAGLQIAIAALQDRQADKLWLDLLSGENTFHVDEGKCSVTVSEETGKLNVNVLKDKSGKLDRANIDQVLRLFDLLNQQKNAQPKISYGLVSSMIDWIDRDDQVTSLPFIRFGAKGAESSYYKKLKPSYACKNDLLETTEELLLVKGMTPEIYDRINDYITVYGDGKININFASALVLQSLSEEVDAGLAQLIVDRRKLAPFGSVAELRELPGMRDSIYQTIRRTTTVKPGSEHYQITSHGCVDELDRTVVAIVHKNAATKNVEMVLYKEL
ncbi:MAG: type II secretion system minor pseudopilin GspK [Sedimentisphaerales bacterium]|nr:type II secretion system minor pseudopilin GspK [Sedimentisphaerales bacterium]